MLYIYQINLLNRWLLAVFHHTNYGHRNVMRHRPVICWTDSLKFSQFIAMRIIDLRERCSAFSAFRKDLDLCVYHRLARYVRSVETNFVRNIPRLWRNIFHGLSSYCTDNISLFTFPYSYNSIAVNFKHLIQRYVE